MKTLTHIESLEITNPRVAGNLEVCPHNCKNNGVCAVAAKEGIIEGCPMSEKDLSLMKLISKYLITGYIG